MNIQGKHWIQLFLVFTFSPAFANPPIESLENIRHTAEEFVLSKISPDDHQDEKVVVQARNLDRRLTLPACSIALESYFPSSDKLDGNLSVGVECKGELPWKVFVGVLVERFGNVLVTNQSLPRGHLLAANDFRFQETNLTRLPTGYVQDPNQLIGLELRRNLSADQPMLFTYTQQPILIKRGEEVQIVATTGSIEVYSKGKAMQNASLGESISVKATNSGRVVEAVAKSQGVVEIKM